MREWYPYIRTCIRCGKSFKTPGRHAKICEKCKKPLKPHKHNKKDIRTIIKELQ